MIACSEGTRAIRVLVVDDHALLRRGLVLLLNGEPDIAVVGEAADGQEAIEMADELRPDVVLMDVTMPRMGGVEATRRIKATWPDVRVIGLSMHALRSTEAGMVGAGAEAYLTKNAEPAALLATLRRRPA